MSKPYFKKSNDVNINRKYFIGGDKLYQENYDKIDWSIKIKQPDHLPESESLSLPVQSDNSSDQTAS